MLKRIASGFGMFRSPIISSQEAHVDIAKLGEEALFLALKGMDIDGDKLPDWLRPKPFCKIRIYQIPNKMLMHIHRQNPMFAPMMFLGFRNFSMPKAMFRKYYKVAWEGSIGSYDLEDIFRVFNVDHPRNYRGRSLSCGDIVQLPDSKYLCNAMGWTKVKY